MATGGAILGAAAVAGVGYAASEYNKDQELVHLPPP